MPGAKITAKNNAASVVRTAQTDAGFIAEATDNIPISVQSRQLANFILTFGAVTQPVETVARKPLDFGHITSTTTAPREIQRAAKFCF